ncbi:hypothetical protein ABID22_003060 [Pontibacter aydingkolensis]|uniref:SpoIIAA-like n=2 Tax=Pontibacter aydingkolensis TaxID=1911536 RepID=A0ABS7CXW9_9BACT|nr:hypothetical protein [Pontibacter aydingkolensis]
MHLSNDYFISQVLLPQKLIFTKFLRPMEHEVYKEAMLYVFTTIKDNNLENWVMDSTKSNFTMQDQKWSVEQLGLLLQDTPLKKVAMVRAKDSMLQIAAEAMRSKIYRIFGTQKELQHFATLEEALRFMLPDTNPGQLLKKLKTVTEA